INCASVASQSASAGSSCSATVPDVRALVRAQSSDSVTPQGSLVVTQNPTQSSPVSGLGSHPITATVTDEAGNSSTCVVGFTVNDTTLPVITTCAANQSVNANGSCAALVPSFTSGVVATDNCDSSVTITQSPAAGSTVSGLG